MEVQAPYSSDTLEHLVPVSSRQSVTGRIIARRKEGIPNLEPAGGWAKAGSTSNHQPLANQVSKLGREFQLVVVSFTKERSRGMDFVDEKHFEEWARLCMRIISDEKLLERMTNIRVLPDPVPEAVKVIHGTVCGQAYRHHREPKGG